MHHDVRKTISPVRFFMAMVVMFLVSNEALALVDVDELEWKHRLIVLFASEAQSAEDLSAFNQAEKEIIERHIVWFCVYKDAVVSNYRGVISNDFAAHLQQTYQRSTDGNEVIVVGKDGAVKYRSGQLDLNEIFNLIDQMPMRQFEMRGLPHN